MVLPKSPKKEPEIIDISDDEETEMETNTGETAAVNPANGADVEMDCPEESTHAVEDDRRSYESVPNTQASWGGVIENARPLSIPPSRETVPGGEPMLMTGGQVLSAPCQSMNCFQLPAPITCQSVGHTTQGPPPLQRAPTYSQLSPSAGSEADPSQLPPPLQPAPGAPADPDASGQALPDPPQPVQNVLRDKELPAMDDIFRRINAGREIACIMCDKRITERLLLHHICDVHYWMYRPFKCDECDYRIGNSDVLISMHLLETGHRFGVENYTVCFERNENIEYLIKLVHRHSLEAHGNDEAGKEGIIKRLLDAARILREHRQNVETHQGGNTDYAGSSQCDSEEEVPIMSPAPPAPCDSDIDTCSANLTSSPTDCTSASPSIDTPAPVVYSTSSPAPIPPCLKPILPLQRHRARKTIVRPVPSSISPPVDIGTPNLNLSTGEMMQADPIDQCKGAAMEADPNNQCNAAAMEADLVNQCIGGVMQAATSQAVAEIAMTNERDDCASSNTTSPPILTPAVNCTPDDSATVLHTEVHGASFSGAVVTDESSSLPEASQVHSSAAETSCLPEGAPDAVDTHGENCARLSDGDCNTIQNATSSDFQSKVSNISIVVKSQPLACDFCSAVVQNTGHLKDHGIKNHTAGYVPYRCDHGQCSFGTWRVRDMREHSRSHGSFPATVVPTGPNWEQRVQLQRLIDSFDSKGLNCGELKRLLQENA